MSRSSYSVKRRSGRDLYETKADDLSLLALMCFITTAKAEDEGGLKELNDLSDTVFQMTRHSQYDEALQVLGYFKKK